MAARDLAAEAAMREMEAEAHAREVEAEWAIFTVEHRREREALREYLLQSESLKEIHKIFLPRLFEDPTTL